MTADEFKTGISFSMKRRRVLIYRCSLRALGMPKNIRFLLNMKKRRVAVQACEAIDRDSFKVPEFNLGSKDQYEITSQSFLKVIYKLAEWNRDKTYQLKGVVYPENRLIEFDLAAAEEISEDEFVDPEINQLV